jgi:hypothetical protein
MGKMSEIKLKPCPFCGSEAEIKRRGTARQSMQITCTNCGCELESGDVVGLTRSDGLAWNRRHPHDALVAERDELRKALERAARDLDLLGEGVACREARAALAKGQTKKQE